MSESLTPWREPLARWPDEWRERWGHRANDLEETGLDWKAAEEQAFVETLKSKREEPPKVAPKIRMPERTLFKESA